MLFLSLDVRRYLPVVRLMVVLGVLFGLWMTGLDLVVGMPLFWAVSEGPVIFLLNCVMIWLASRVSGLRAPDKNSYWVGGGFSVLSAA